MKLTRAGSDDFTAASVPIAEDTARVEAEHDVTLSEVGLSYQGQLSGCDGEIVNCLSIIQVWNYTFRFYGPRAELLNGRWKLPEAQPAS
ncbi:hypothetical protein [Ancylobacter defluvii]|uniref:hypothetical protein n=1 Tax=Ancylobacter defluvii TaxID=1282440 RepID=UPI001BCCDBF1|nr:hypothetical protein [Ancylobacter defluvii]MBS7586270.1 hypothetical protein [Ancylobacter defluvii]